MGYLVQIFGDNDLVLRNFQCSEKTSLNTAKYIARMLLRDNKNALYAVVVKDGIVIKRYRD